MTRRLDVYLHRHFAGQYEQRTDGRLSFRYAASWLEHEGATPISQSLPLRANRFSHRECQGFFAGLLPDDAKREAIARILGVSAGNDYAMLERLGGECAGAITFLPEGAALPEHRDQYRALTEADLAGILRELPRRPLLAGENGIRLSLAGAQDKIAVCLRDGSVSLPLDGAPTTHILKPAVERFAGVVFNEAYCMRLAARAGLPAATVEIRRAEDIDYLQVERYDRWRQPAPDGPPVLRRLHQEDFCQALGCSPDRKYQKEGGPSLAQCFELLQRVSTVPLRDLSALLNAVVFHYLIGNNDAHGKNYSLLYGGLEGEGRTVRLAPLYDVVSTACYPELSPDLAMRIGRTYTAEQVTIADFDELARAIGWQPAQVRGWLRGMVERVAVALDAMPPEEEAARQVAQFVQRRVQRARSWFPG